MRRNRLYGFVALLLILVGSVAEAARVRVVRRGPRATVRVTAGFPLRRPLPRVVVGRPAVVVRVAPRAYLPRLVFGAAVVALPVAAAIAWSDEEVFAAGDEWTEVTYSVERRGTRLLLDVSGGAARVSFAEVVFENGDAQVVDFDDGKVKRGVYTLLDFADGRAVDHVRLVARALDDETTISVRLVS